MERRIILITAFLAISLLVTACSGSDPAPPPPSGSNSISGTINVAKNTYSDSDINDIYAPAYISNNSFADAQSISKPAVVGGYVKGSSGGVSGQLSSDTADFYKVSLLIDETVKLYISDLGEDLDLELFDVGMNSVATSLGTTQVETVISPGDGDYYIKVFTASSLDASNYSLTAGQVQIAGVNNYFSNDDFAPGEILLRFKDEVVPLGIQKTAKAQAELVGLQHKSGAPGRVMLFSLGEESQRQQTSKTLGFQATIVGGKYTDATARLKLDTMKAVQALRKRSDIFSADLNYRHKPLEVPTDTNYSSQWHYPLVDLPLAWDEPGATHGNGAIVAVIDTGVLINHPDLINQISTDGGYDFISSTAISNDGNGIDPDPNDPGDKIPPETRSSFHGTHVAGTIAAETCLPTSACGHTSTIGVAGVAPRAKIMPLRVLGQGGGYDSDIIQAMYYAADLDNNSGTKPSLRNGGARADIINMSLGGGSYSSTFQAAVNQVRAAGVIIIAAAGNSSTSTPSYPAAYDGVVAVSAVNRNKALAYYSNYGSWVDVAAPGGETSGGSANGILSTLGDDSGGSTVYTYGFYQGTSMAAPHMAGVAALMRGYVNINGGSLTPTEFDAKLANGDLTEDIGIAGKDTSFGYGLINANMALVAAGLVLDIPPVIRVDNTVADLGGSATSLTITITNGDSGLSKGTLDGLSVATDGSPWLGVGTLSKTQLADDVLDPNDFATFDITVDRASLTDGYYSGSVTISSSSPSADDVVIQVVMYKGSDVGDAGYQYITLVNADTRQVVKQIATSRDPVYGTYSFNFANVPEGNYFIVSGTDMDNDFFFCDDGEACGSYPDVGSFTVNGGNVSGIQFESGYYVPSAIAGINSAATVNRVLLRKSAGSKQMSKQ